MHKETKQHVMRLILLTVLLLMAAIVCQPAKAQAAKEKFKIAKGWLGDVDANGTVNGNDLDKLLKYLNGWKTCTAEKVFGDADGDGEYSENDKTFRLPFFKRLSSNSNFVT